MSTSCLICGARNFIPVFYQERCPACQGAPLLPEDIGSELIGKLDIVECQNCSHIFNLAADAVLIEQMYKKNYSSGIPFSKGILDRFYHIAETAIQRENIEGKVCLEIGASDFTFSKILLENGANRIIAFEPSEHFTNADSRINHLKNYFDIELLPANLPPLGLVILRHVLEHMPDPMKAIKQVASALDDGGHLYIEVPNISNILENARVYDFFYEHVSYFAPELLELVLWQLGFVTEKITYLVSGQHFGILARKVEKTTPTHFIAQESLALRFPERQNDFTRLQNSFEKYRQNISHLISQGKKVAIYGAGCHAIGTTVLLNLKRDDVNCLLDNDPLKIERYSPLSHIQIHSPRKKDLHQFDKIIIIASLHQMEIFQELRSKYKFKGQIYGTYPEVSLLN